MPADPRRELAEAAAGAWARYDSTVKLGGTSDQRHWAFETAMEADRKLAEFDWAQQTAERREKAVRALSGA